MKRKHFDISLRIESHKTSLGNNIFSPKNELNPNPGTRITFGRKLWFPLFCLIHRCKMYYTFYLKIKML